MTINRTQHAEEIWRWHRAARRIGALLVMLAVALPVARAATADQESGDVQAAHLSGSLQAPILDAADCTASNDGTARYFATIRSTTGVDIPEALARLLFTGIPGLLPPGTPTSVNLFNGDFESQAADGNQPSCVPAVNDGHPNDVGSPFIPSLPDVFTWRLVVTVPGFFPQTFSLANATDGQGSCPLGDPDPARAGCLISVGQILLQPLAGVAGRGKVAGSIFGSDGWPLDGVTITLKDVSGSVHTRISGSNCVNGTVISVPGTGFYCFDDSSPTAEDGLGLPVGPANIVMVNNTVVNCGPTGSATPGALCGFMPATVTVNVAATTVTTQHITLQNKFAPAPPAPSGAGAFGYVVNDAGQGVGGITISAGRLSTTTSPQTGLWQMSGLAANTPVIFTISGPGLSAANVRPGLSITQRAGAVGTWIDPNWIASASSGGDVGGKNFTLQAGSGGVVTLSWDPGATQTSYILTTATSSGQIATVLSGSATSFVDVTGTGQPISCYLLAAVNGPTALGISPMLCIFRNLQTGTAPATLNIRLEGLGTPSTARLSWSAVPGTNGYIAAPVPAGAPPQAGPSTNASFSISGAGCFTVIPTLNGIGLGNSNLVCGVPGIATLADGPPVSQVERTLTTLQTTTSAGLSTHLAPVVPRPSSILMGGPR